MAGMLTGAVEEDPSVVKRGNHGVDTHVFPWSPSVNKMHSSDAGEKAQWL